MRRASSVPRRAQLSCPAAPRSLSPRVRRRSPILVPWVIMQRMGTVSRVLAALAITQVTVMACATDPEWSPVGEWAGQGPFTGQYAYTVAMRVDSSSASGATFGLLLAGSWQFGTVPCGLTSNGLAFTGTLSGDVLTMTVPCCSTETYTAVHQGNHLVVASPTRPTVTLSRC